MPYLTTSVSSSICHIASPSDPMLRNFLAPSVTTSSSMARQPLPRRSAVPRTLGHSAELTLAAKRADYFAAGTQVVWDIDIDSPQS